MKLYATTARQQKELRPAIMLRRVSRIKSCL
jgi:hypothetical protein